MANERISPSFQGLSSWIDKLQSQGRYFFTREQALKDVPATSIAFSNASLRLARKKRIARIYRGFYIIIPLEYASTGILPPEWFIADLMNYLKMPYYVGLLSAANLHGAAHQQPQEFQVITTSVVRTIKVKSLSLRFFTKKNFTAVQTEQVKVQTGFISAGTPESTALDLVCYARQIGGLDRVLTVFHELGEKLNADKLAAAAKAGASLACAQRLGWLLEKAGCEDKTEKLARWVSNQRPLPARLEPSLAARQCEKNERWSLLLNTQVESDL